MEMLVEIGFLSLSSHTNAGVPTSRIGLLPQIFP